LDSLSQHPVWTSTLRFSLARRTRQVLDRSHANPWLIDSLTIATELQRASRLAWPRSRSNKQGRNNMKAFKMLLAVLCSAVLLGTIGTSLGRPSTLGYPAPERYRLDASESKFIAHALRGGLLWFKGHDHLVAASQFSGEA